VWVAGSQTWLKDSAALVNYAGDQTGVTVGADHKFWPNLVLGVAVTHENLDISTYFNGGRLESNGTTVAPYVVWTIGGPFSLDATAGYTRSDIDQTYAPALVVGGVHASTHSHRGMFAGNLNYTSFVDDWILGGKVGTLLVAERVGSFTDSAGFSYEHQTNTLGQLQVGPNVSRIASWGSYGVSAAYLYDYNHLETVSPPGGARPSIDRDGVQLTGNLNATVSKGVALNLTLSREFLRDNVHNTNVAAMLAISF
ncbi:MAG TPA: autotransporter outer membrane beta-barrel domain-containing protein, partial [Alphaproteobacteria bacterium]|nr:autotransporter outer membrane beta-barrel domain-containing protein [Alphaproteobacteria bacterium]